MAICTVKITQLSFSVASFQQLFGVIDIAVHHAAAVPADNMMQILTCRQHTSLSDYDAVSPLIAIDKLCAAAEGTLLDLNGMKWILHHSSPLSEFFS